MLPYCHSERRAAGDNDFRRTVAGIWDRSDRNPLTPRGAGGSDRGGRLRWRFALDRTRLQGGKKCVDTAWIELRTAATP